MLISVRHLVDRMRYSRSRADDLAKLRARFAAQPGPWEASDEQRALAAELRRLRRALAAEFEGVSACSGCARGHPLPAGRWDGGHCCAGGTFRVFTAEEVAVLKLAGTTPADLVPPDGDHAGCAFRGERGCSLAAEHRPTLCTRYLCMELRTELRHDARWRAIGALRRQIDRTFQRLQATFEDDPCGSPLRPV